MAETLLVNARIATMRGGRYSFVENGALRTSDGRIEWIGRSEAVSEKGIDLGGALVTPGLIDAHTHLVHAGDRSEEFERRLQGESYEAIARSGGGILSTVRATRKAPQAQLRAESAARLEAMMREGVTTVEVKSGYGLDLESEVKCLRVARSLGSQHVRVVTTFLGAHTVPPEYAGRPEEYVEEICTHWLPEVARLKLADAVDAFCERIAFTPAQTRRVFEAARAQGLPVKLHADQLSDLGGAALAAEFGALSADHLEHATDEGIAAMARAGTVAVLLPGAFYFLRETHLPPIDALRRAGVPIAVASDCNPGTSPITSPITILNMACTLFRLTPEEALAGVTVNAARALGLAAEIGTLEAGKRADFVVWDAHHPAALCAQIGAVRPRAIYFGGTLRQ